MRMIYKNKRGETLNLTDDSDFVLTNIDSQTAAAANVSSLVFSGADGDEIKHMQAQPRIIVIDLQMIADPEITKRKILSVVKLKQKGALIWEQENRFLQIEGAVESIDMPRWNDAVTMQITLHCSVPFWENLDYVIAQIQAEKSLHYFTNTHGQMLYFPEEGIPLSEYDTTRTKTFYNSGDVSVGIEIEIQAFRTVTNPIIYDEYGNFFGVGYGTGAKKIVMNPGETIKINTRHREKSVTKNGVNLLKYIKPKSKWLQLETGANTFTINSDDVNIDNMTFSLIYKQRYI